MKSGTVTSSIHWLFHFIRYMFRQFVARRGFQTASSLAYTTLLSIVPLVGVMFSFFGNLPVFKEVSDVIQEFIFGNFVPAFGETVREYLVNFSIKASQLTATGIIVLVIIALLLMSTIETALNETWHVVRKRSPHARFLIYWAILTVGPILVGISLYSTSYLLALPLVDTVDSSLHIKTRLLALMPFITTTLAFTLLYILVPNRHVSRRFALIGGVTAALLFEFAKYAFGIYIRAVPTYEMIYGAIAVIPMFLIWIYLSWLIVLLGAQIAYSLSVFRLEDADKPTERQKWDFFDAYRVIGELWKSQKGGNYLTAVQIRKCGLQVPHLLINEILEILQHARWAYRTSAGTWLLTRDLNELTLLDLHKLLPCKLPDSVRDESDVWQLTLRNILANCNTDLERVLAVPLGALFRQAEPQE